jgi:hypothetical protein
LTAEQRHGCGPHLHHVAHIACDERTRLGLPITTPEPTKRPAPITARMAVILDRRSVGAWLNVSIALNEIPPLRGWPGKGW